MLDLLIHSFEKQLFFFFKEISYLLAFASDKTLHINSKHCSTNQINLWWHKYIIPLLKWILLLCKTQYFVLYRKFIHPIQPVYFRALKDCFY